MTVAGVYNVESTFGPAAVRSLADRIIRHHEEWPRGSGAGTDRSEQRVPGVDPPRHLSHGTRHLMDVSAPELASIPDSLAADRRARCCSRGHENGLGCMSFVASDACRLPVVGRRGDF